MLTYKIRRYLFWRGKGFRPAMAWCCADLPRWPLRLWLWAKTAIIIAVWLALPGVIEQYL